MFDTITYVKCEVCKKETVADLHDCGCIFYHCEFCGAEGEIDDNCKNVESEGK
jgi:hypothetical protein